ncbi:hypothetical protein GIB67_011129 [Kingdonia uniflora]|uniref:OVATE domain-containing protein n=1 Tax=Kingdonia uniflora TaxID=39325 RepID=A0A7J7PAI5_9MAGN|nr:hypothetical protein GIB67_011129 [Kingdonia uniflora]
MLLKNTKKFFKTTIQTFKSLFFGDYQRLPKSPSYKSLKTQQSLIELDNFYNDFTNRWELSKDKVKAKSKRRRKKEEKGKQLMEGDQDVYNGSFMKFSKKAHQRQQQQSIRDILRICDEEEGEEEKEREETNDFVSRRVEVTQKLKELELIDLNNVDHVMDIEEVLHYYSRLTCPFYVEIVDNFTMRMYSELFESLDS